MQCKAAKVRFMQLQVMLLSNLYSLGMLKLLQFRKDAYFELILTSASTFTTPTLPSDEPPNITTSCQP